MKRIVVAAAVLLSALSGHSAGAAEGAKARILFDQGHNQRFVIEDEGTLQLSKLAEVMRAQGGQVEAVRAPLEDELLKGAQAVIISGPFESLKPQEVAALIRFVEQGGRLALMLHIPGPLEGVLDRLGMAYTNMVLHERSNVLDNDINFRLKEFAPHPLMAGLKQFSVYGAWGLNPGEHAQGIAATTRTAWVDMNGDRVLSPNDITGRFNVVVSGSRGKGAFVVFGDDAIFQNRYLDEDNLKLAVNLAAWLIGK